MLSIGEVCAANAGYYVGLARVHDYYRETEDPGLWWGGGLTSLDLQSGIEVNPRSFRSLLRGFHPLTGEALTQNAGVFSPSNPRSRRAGHDLCFSAPKSVSVLWAASDDVTRACILQAHRTAVETSLSRVEEMVAWTRTGAQGSRMSRCDGLVVALFEHFASREGDMQIHTHSVVLNLAQSRDDGKWRSLDTRGHFVRGRKLEWGKVYRNVLRNELRRELGLGFRDTPEKGSGTWEIRGIPQDVLDDYSKRRQQILAHGYDSAASAAEATLKTRAPKTESPSSRARLFRTWREDLRSRYRDFWSFEVPRETHEQRTHTQEAARGRLFQEDEARKRSKPSGEQKRDHDNHREHDSSSPEASLFRRLRRRIDKLLDARDALLQRFAPRPANRVDHALLIASQHKKQRTAIRDAVRNTGTTHSPYRLTEKSLSMLSRIYESNDLPFYTLSLTKERSERLREAGVERAMTIASARAVLQPRTPIERNWSRRGLASAIWWPPGKLWPRLMNHRRWLSPSSVLCIETTGHPTPRDLSEVLALAERAKARVILSGDLNLLSLTREQKRWFATPPRFRDDERAPTDEELFGESTSRFENRER